MSASKGFKALTILTKCIKAPLHVLIRARDFYVNSLTNCAGRAQQGPARGFAGMVPVSRSQSHGFYRSGTSSSEGDIQELIRAASKAGMGPGFTRGGKQSQLGVGPRSQSVGMGTIHEDGPGEFADDAKLPKSKSCTVVIGGPVVRQALGER
ncbi:hypothetical protein FCM35_KLT15133 [Carex littledalei]|uniref:Uncharacterized protein n=1 Tax=Carex littledalei TaxID=544730 RepID=A0A833QGF4_9POAL|nr:hypothetical protein FCM35_KLT15133 [Carex littledalei]